MQYKKLSKQQILLVQHDFISTGLHDGKIYTLAIKNKLFHILYLFHNLIQKLREYSIFLVIKGKFFKGRAQVVFNIVFSVLGTQLVLKVPGGHLVGTQQALSMSSWVPETRQGHTSEKEAAFQCWSCLGCSYPHP